MIKSGTSLVVPVDSFSGWARMSALDGGETVEVLSKADNEAGAEVKVDRERGRVVVVMRSRK